MKRIIILLCGLLALGLFSISVLGANVKTVNQSFTPITYFPVYTPHAYLSGFTGTNTIGEADILMPVWLRTDKNLFIYAQGRYGNEKPSWANNSWTGSLGAGYRQIANLFGYSSILGFYTLGEYAKTPDAHSAWLISPGVESLGRTYDVRINGYFPVSEHNWTTEGFANDFGNYDYVSFKGHSMLDAKFIYHEESGPGTDIEIGRKLFNCHGTLVKAYLGSYFFYMKHNPNIYGGAARITIQPTTYLEFSLNDAYDKYVHNVFMAGVQVSLYDLFSHGDKHINANDLQRRLFDPLERNFGQIGSGSDLRVTGGPDSGVAPEIADAGGHGFTELDNVWFFQGNAATSASNATITWADGTFENPLTPADFSQSTLNGINVIAVGRGFSATNLFFAGGTYSAVNGASPLSLYAGQAMWGRMGNSVWKGFKEPATGNDRPLFNGGLELLNGTFALDSIRLVDNDTVNGWGEAIDMDNGAQLSMNNSSVYASDRPTTGDAVVYGINIDNGSVLTINGNTSNITAYAKAGSDSGVSASAEATAYGIHIGATSPSSIIISGNTNTISAAAMGGSILSGSSVDVRASAVGIYFELSADSSVTISGNDNTVSAVANGGIANVTSSANAAANSDGIAITGGSGSTLTINGNSNTLSAVADGGTATTTNSTGFAAATTNGLKILLGAGTTTISGDGNIFSAVATGGAQDGVLLDGVGNATGISLFSGAAAPVDFLSSAIGTAIIVRGAGHSASASFGMFSSGAGFLIDGVAVPSGSLSDFTSLITFTRLSGAGSGGDRIDGNGGTLSW